MTFRIFILTFILVNLTGSIPAQVVLNGVVVLQNSKYNTGQVEYVSGATIIATGALTTITNDAGRFRLTFPTKSSGDLISIEANKAGFVVVNREELASLILSDQQQPIKVVLAPEDEYYQAQIQYYEIAKEALQTEYQSYRDKLLKEGSERDSLIIELEERWNVKIDTPQDALKVLEEKQNSLPSEVLDLADRFASVNLDDQSYLFVTAFEAFREGDLGRAIEMLNEEDLLFALESFERSRLRLDSTQNELYGEITKVKAEYRLMARLHLISYEFEKAIKAYEILLELDSSDLEIVIEFAEVFQEVNRLNQAVTYYERALKLVENERDKANIYNNLGIIYSQLNAYSKAESAYFQSRSIYIKLTKTDPIRFEPLLATTNNNLGILYQSQYNFKKAEESFLEALKIYQRQEEDYFQVFEPKSAAILNNLGALYTDLNAYEKAEEAYLEASEIYQRLSRINPERFEPDLADLQNNLGLMYADLNAYENAESAYLEALEIYQRLAVANPERYEPDVAMTQNNLGILYWNLNAYENAESAYLEALEIYQRLAVANPERYEPDVAMTQNNLGILYWNLNAYENAESAYLEALEIRKRLAVANPERYEPDVAGIQNNLGSMYADLNSFELAETSYLKALEIYRSLAQTNPDQFEPYLATIQNNLGNLYRDLNAYESATAVYLEALKIYRRLAQANPNRFELDVANTQNNLGAIYADLNDFEQAEVAYAEALEIYQRLAQANPESYEPKVAGAQNNIGNMYADLNAYEQAEPAYLEALETYRRLAQANPERFLPDIAITQNNLGTLYRNLNAFEQAETAYLEALEIYRRLAQGNPRRYEQYVANILNNLGNLLSSLNAYEQARAAYLEALKIRNRLAQTNPKIFAPYVANTKNNLANLYSSLGEYEQAETLFLEAISTYRKLSNDNLMVFEPELAISLHNLSNLYFTIGDEEQGRKAYLEYQEIYQRFATTKSDEGNPHRKNLDDRLAFIEKRSFTKATKADLFTSATSVSSEDLSKKQQNISTLTLKGNTLRAKGDFSAALKAFEQAVDQDSLNVSLYIQIFSVAKRIRVTEKMESHANRFMQVAETLRDTAIAHFLIGTYHDESGTYVSSLRNYQQAISILREVRDTFQMKRVLQSLGPVCTKLNLQNKSLSYYYELLELIAEASTESPTPIFIQLGDLHFSMNDDTSALRCYLNAFKYQQLFRDRKNETHFAEKAEIHKRIGDLYYQQDSLGKAIREYQEAIQINDSLYQNAPSPFIYQERLAYGYFQLGLVKSTIKSPAAGMAALERALTIYEDLAQKYPKTFNFHVAKTLFHIYQILTNTDGPDSKLTLSERDPAPVLERSITLLEKYPERYEAYQMLQTAIILKEKMNK